MGRMDSMDPFDLVGDVLDGQFRVDEFIGEGALSVVYRAHNEGVDAPACVKCLNLPSTLDPTFARSIVASFQEGCKLHFRLARGHLAIAQTFASGSTVAPRTGGQVQYIVREWFEGESLAGNLRRRRAEGEHGRSLEEIIELFDPIASALTYAQTQGSSHLSLMPSNMFLAEYEDQEPTLKLLDFGVGRVVDDAASTRGNKPEPRMRILLPTYAAPEQLLGTLGPVGSWTDVYAFALVLLEVLSGKPVMSEKDAGALVARALSTRSRPTPREQGVELPPAVDAAISRALLLEPESRFMTVAELWDEILASTRPARSERRRLVAHLRRLRRARKSIAPLARPVQTVPDDTSRDPAFPPEEAPTTKARGVVAMLTARTMRASTRPPPKVPSKKPSMTAKPRPKAPPVKPARPQASAAPAPIAEPISNAAPADEVAQEALAHQVSVPPPMLLPKLVPEMVLVAPPLAAPLSAPVVDLAPPPPPQASESYGRLETHEVSVREPEAVLPSPFALPRRSLDLPRHVLLAGGVGVVVLLSGILLIVALVRRGHGSSDTRSGALTSATAHATSTIAPAETPTTPATTSQVVDTASAIASAPPAPPASTGRPGRFNRKRSLAAIAEVTTDLSDCRKKPGVWGIGQAGVVFKNDGTVRTVMMGAPFLGPQGDCVKAHIAQARTDPFVGIIGPVYANFVIPY